MKTISFSVMLFYLIFSASFAQHDESVSIFDKTFSTSIFAYEETHQTSNRHFGFTEINGDFLQPITFFSYNNSGWVVPGMWKPNSEGTFGSINIFDSGVSQPISNSMILVDLNGNGKKDVVVVTGSNLKTFLNNSNTISGINQTINDGSGTYADAGNFNSDNTSNDVAVVNNGYVRIFKNFGNGNLSTSYYGPFNLSASKVKVRKMTTKISPYIENLSIKADLVIISGSYVKVYVNDDDNGIISTPFASIDVGFTISDLEVADMNGDGYNYIIVTGEDQIRVYLNDNGTSINSTSSFDGNENYSSYLINPLVKAYDLDRDGRRDLIFMSSFEGAGVLYLNSPTGMDEDLYQTFELNSNQTGNTVYQIDVFDIYNTGAPAFIFSFNYFIPLTSVYPSKLNFLEPIDMDPPPVPPHVNKSQFLDGSLFRPVLNIHKRDERDVGEFEIWKKKIGVSEPPYVFEYLTTISASTGDITEFIDYSEYIVYAPPPNGNRYEPNCFYYVVALDKELQESANSNEVDFMVGTDVVDKEESDNFSSGSEFKIPTPKDFKVNNFPNPFNPTTKIVFTLPSSEFVSLKVYNVLGQEVKTLINEPRHKGYHWVEFDGSSLSSGLYFYVIQAGQYKETKRIILLK